MLSRIRYSSSRSQVGHCCEAPHRPILSPRPSKERPGTVSGREHVHAHREGDGTRVRVSRAQLPERVATPTIGLARGPGAAAVGSERAVVVPSPSCPSVLSPQQNAAPSGARAQAWYWNPKPPIRGVLNAIPAGGTTA